MKFRNNITLWIESDRNNPLFWYSSMLDLYAFPRDNQSPYTQQIQAINDPYIKIEALETSLANNVGYAKFIPYVQLHEFEAFLLVDPDRLLSMYPDAQSRVGLLKIGNMRPEEINESPQNAPSKRIIYHLPEYKGQKAQVVPLVAQDIGLTELRQKCPHFNAWITKLENI